MVLDNLRCKYVYTLCDKNKPSYCSLEYMRSFYATLQCQYTPALPGSVVI